MRRGEGVYQSSRNLRLGLDGAAFAKPDDRCELVLMIDLDASTPAMGALHGLSQAFRSSSDFDENSVGSTRGSNEGFMHHAASPRVLGKFREMAISCTSWSIMMCHAPP